MVFDESRINHKEAGSKKEQILHAAVEKFLEKDFYQVTVTEIAELAEVGKGTVYEYFSSKEELFKECFSYCADAYLKLFEAHLEEVTSARQTMENIFINHLALIKENRRKLHLLFNERPQSFKELQDWILKRRRELIESVTGLIKEGIRLGEIRPDVDVELAGRFFLALNHMVIGEMVVLDNIEVEEERLKDLLDIYWNGIGNNRSWQGH